MAFLFRLLWGTTKFGVKHIVIPIATTMIIAAIANKLSERLNGAAADATMTSPERAAWHAQP